MRAHLEDVVRRAPAVLQLRVDATNSSESTLAAAIAGIKATLTQVDRTIAVTCHLLRGTLLVTLVGYPKVLDNLGDQGFADQITASLLQADYQRSRPQPRRA